MKLLQYFGTTFLPRCMDENH